MRTHRQSLATAERLEAVLEEDRAQKAKPRPTDRLWAEYEEFLLRAPISEVVARTPSRITLSCGHEQGSWTCNPTRRAVRCLTCWLAMLRGVNGEQLELGGS